MSYCRRGEDSDVYIVSTGYGYECVNCLLKPRYNSAVNMANSHLSTVCQTQDHMLIHIKKHQRAGHLVPERAIKRLQTEADHKYKNYRKLPKSYKKLKRTNPDPNKAFKRK